MKTTPLLPLGLALASSAFAQVVTYSDVSLLAPGTETIQLSLDPDHRFIDPGSGGATAVRYYGGTLNFTGPSGWDGGARMHFGNENGLAGNFYLNLGNGGTQWTFLGSDSNNNGTGITSGTIDFVIKIEDAPWNQAGVKLFVGAGALSATEGTPYRYITPDLVLPIDLNLTSISFILSNSTSSENEFYATNLFSSTEWTPVGASSIPEPSSFALLGGFAALGLAATRRRHRAE